MVQERLKGWRSSSAGNFSHRNLWALPATCRIVWLAVAARERLVSMLSVARIDRFPLCVAAGSFKCAQVVSGDLEVSGIPRSVIKVG